MSQFVVIGNPSNRRVSLFQSSLSKYLPEAFPATVVAWSDLLSEDRAFDKLRSLITPTSLVRIESPGENAQVEQLLIKRGADCQGQPLPTDLPIEHGRIQHSQLWYAGLTDAMNELSRIPAQWMNSPQSITQLFNKPECQQRLHQSGVCVPDSLGIIRNYDQLRTVMRESDVGRVFLKPWHGSSASGVVALQVGRNRLHAQTPVEIVQDQGQTKLFNSLKLRTYTRESDVAVLVDQLSHEGLLAEEWLPKTGFQGKTVDLRIMVINGHPMHMVLRTSKSAITNLHLGNSRGDTTEFWKQLPPSTQAGIATTCQRAAKAYPDCLYFGLDLLIAPGFRRHAVLELNAFGDLLPGILHCGKDIYESEIDAAISCRL